MTPDNLHYMTTKHPGDNVVFRTKLRGLVVNQCGNLSAVQRDNMQRILREEFLPAYSTDLWCATCVMSMAKILHDKFEAYMAEQERLAAAVEDEQMQEALTDPVGPVKATFPKHEQPIADKTEKEEKVKTGKSKRNRK